MISLTKRLFYKNADEQIEKLLEISWGIPDDKQIEHEFDIESDVPKITR